jgi:phenylacetate-CoA ligase
VTVTARSNGGPAGEELTADPEGGIWNSLETLDRTELTAKQDSSLPERIRKAYEEGGLYRHAFESAGVSPDDYTGREDLQKFPLVSKDMVRAFRAETGDPFGGLSAGVVPGASVSHGSGTSGVATLQVSSPSDRETVADELASMFWMAGARRGTKILSIQNFGVRVELTLPAAAFKIGAVHILPDVGSSSIDQLENIRPAITWAYPGWLDGLVAATDRAGRDLAAVLDPLQTLWWGGRYLSPLKRERLEARVGATIYEMGGMGDIGLHTSSCLAQNGMHIREDLFVVETIDPETAEPLPPGVPGELVFTSLWDEGMNHVRWRSDDFGLLKTEPCGCGRTSARIFQLGRVWERTVVDGVAVMPGEIDDILYEVADQDVPFQIVRSADGTRRAFVRVAVPSGFGVDEVGKALCSRLGVEMNVLDTPIEDLVGPADAKYAHKYAQVRDE